MGSLILIIIVTIIFIIWAKKLGDKENEKHYKRMQEVIKNAIKQALNEREEEMFNDFENDGPFDDEEENLDDYEHLEEKRKAVEETIDSIVEVLD